MCIRYGEEKDIKEVVSLLNKYISYGTAKEREVRGYIREGRLKVYETVGVIEGVVIYIDSPEWWYSYEVSHLVVKEEARGKGIGQKLLKEVTEELSKEKDIYLIGWEQSKSKKWYAKTISEGLGYKKQRYERDYFKGSYCGVCEGDCRCSAYIYKKEKIKG